MAEETYDITIGARVSKRQHELLLAEQKRLGRLSGIDPSLNEGVRLLIERGLANGKKR